MCTKNLKTECECVDCIDPYMDQHIEQQQKNPIILPLFCNENEDRLECSCDIRTSINNLLNKKDLYFKKCIPLVDFIETYQGEGPNCGRKMVLTRFKYCNKLCPFCDTQKLTKDITPDLFSLKDIEMVMQNSPNLMITGGEPTLTNPYNGNCCPDDYIPSQFECTIMMAALLNYGFLDIETNGYNLYYLSAFCSELVKHRNKQINISWSPKFVDKDDYNKNIVKLETLSTSSYQFCKPIIKIVIGDDLEEYKNFIYQAVFNYHFDNNRIYLMPKGTTLDEINQSMKLVMQVASDLKCNISSRLHIIHNFK